MRLTALLAVALAAPAAAQHVVTYDPAPAGTGLFFETQVASQLVPGGLPTEPGYAIVLPLPFVGGPGVPAGDATYDGLTNRIWHTNGQILAAQVSANLPVSGPAIAPFPIAPAVLATIGGPVTGMAIDPVANVMYVASGAGIVVGITPAPGTPVVVPPFVLPFLPAPLTGMDYDSVTNTLYVCDATGYVFQVGIGGGLLAPPIGPLALAGLAGDVCIDKTKFLGATGVRPIYVCAGPMMRDVAATAAPAILVGSINPTGLAFLGRAATQPGASIACGGYVPKVGTTTAMTTGNPAFGLRVKDLPTLSPVLFAVDVAWNPLGVSIFGGNPLHLIPGSPTLVVLPSMTNAAGEAVLPIGLAGVPVGTGAFYAQALWTCGAAPAGLALTETMSFQVTGH